MLCFEIKISLVLGFLCSGITLHHSDQLAYSTRQKKTSEKSDVVLMTSAKKIQLQLFSTPTSIYLLVICSSVVVNYFSFNWHSYMQYPTNNCIIECIYMYQWPSYLLCTFKLFQKSISLRQTISAIGGFEIKYKELHRPWTDMILTQAYKSAKTEQKGILE